MAQQSEIELKEFLKTISSMISELASSLDSYVEDEQNQEVKHAFKEQVAEAEKMANELDKTILSLILQK
jgi:hypothetical protein